MEIEFTKFEKTKEEGVAFYKNLGEVTCSYFKEKVIFNSDGLEHLSFKRRGKARSREDQYMRFKLIFLAPDILKLSRTVQGVSEVNRFEEVYIHGRKEKVLCLVRYYEFIAVIKTYRVKVVVKQIGEGPKFFFSIIPSWKPGKEAGTRLLHDEDIQKYDQ